MFELQRALDAEYDPDVVSYYGRRFTIRGSVIELDHLGYSFIGIEGSGP